MTQSQYERCTNDKSGCESFHTPYLKPKKPKTNFKNAKIVLFFFFNINSVPHRDILTDQQTYRRPSIIPIYRKYHIYLQPRSTTLLTSTCVKSQKSFEMEKVGR